VQTEIARKRELIHSLLHIHSNSIIAKGDTVISAVLFIQTERVYFWKYFETFFLKNFYFFFRFVWRFMSQIQWISCCFQLTGVFSLNSPFISLLWERKDMKMDKYASKMHICDFFRSEVGYFVWGEWKNFGLYKPFCFNRIKLIFWRKVFLLYFLLGNSKKMEKEWNERFNKIQTSHFPKRKFFRRIWVKENEI
jgi:hypothetical protein